MAKNTLVEFPTIPPVAGRAIVQGFCAQAVISCSCGKSGPMLIIFLPQASVKVTCPNCQTTFQFGAISWDFKMQYPNVQFLTAQPQVIIPPANGNVTKG